MKIALCDDDEKELSNIRSLLDSYQKTHNIPFTYQEYHSSCELALRASKERFDIYLLDILAKSVLSTMLPILFFLQPHRILRWKVIR